jgi:hypothetical protein
MFGNIMAGRDDGHGVQVNWIHSPLCDGPMRSVV